MKKVEKQISMEINGGIMLRHGRTLPLRLVSREQQDGSSTALKRNTL